MAQMGTCSGRAITDSTKEISSSCFKLAIRKRSTFAVIGQREERAQGILPKATVEAFPSYSTLKSMFRRASFTTSAVHHPPRVRVIRQPPANFKAIDMQLKLQKHANGQVSHQWLLWVLLGINATVFVIWQYADNSSQRYKDPALWIAMYKNFMCSFLNLNEGRWWVLFSACISHSDLQHFAFNMLSLFFMATPVLALIGPSTFLALYFGAGMASCTFSLGWRKYVTPWIYQETWSKQKQSFSMQIGCHGASGAVFAIITTFACINPRQVFFLFFVLPVPAYCVVPGLFAWDLYSAWYRPHSGTDSAAHVGGVIAGLLFWRFKLNGIQILQR